MAGTAGTAHLGNIPNIPYKLMLSNKLEAAFSKELLLRDWLGTSLLVVTDCFCNTCELFHALPLIYKSLFWPTSLLTFGPSNSLPLPDGKEWVNDWVGAFLYLPARVKPVQQYLCLLNSIASGHEMALGHCAWFQRALSSAPGVCPGPHTWTQLPQRLAHCPLGQHNSPVWALWTFPNYCYQDSGMFS